MSAGGVYIKRYWPPPTDTFTSQSVGVMRLMLLRANNGVCIQLCDFSLTREPGLYK